jgi:hypothetical protein
VKEQTLKMGQTRSPETLVTYQKTTPGKNPKDFIQQTFSYHPFYKYIRAIKDFFDGSGNASLMQEDLRIFWISGLNASTQVQVL